MWVKKQKKKKAPRKQKTWETLIEAKRISSEQKQKGVSRAVTETDARRSWSEQKTARFIATIPAAIIVGRQVPSYITDRWSLRCTSAAVLLNPRGNPPLPIQITLHMAQGSDEASDTEHTNPGPQPHSPAQRRPHPVVSMLWKNIFQCL